MKYKYNYLIMKRLLLLLLLICNAIDNYAQSAYMYEAQRDAMESDGLNPQKIIFIIILFIICFFIYIIVFSLKENYNKQRQQKISEAKKSEKKIIDILDKTKVIINNKNNGK